MNKDFTQVKGSESQLDSIKSVHMSNMSSYADYENEQDQNMRA